MSDHRDTASADVGVSTQRDVVDVMKGIGTARSPAKDETTCARFVLNRLVDDLQRFGGQPARRVTETTPRLGLDPLQKTSGLESPIGDP